MCCVRRRTAARGEEGYAVVTPASGEYRGGGQ
ncbi:hypothetical protein GA0115241_110918 [Streptomyces sp. DpondAA-D4]|nr:hypothetical protein GA0115241_110918 [Streptomyces sp. DpondAA-D4]